MRSAVRRFPVLVLPVMLYGCSGMYATSIALTPKPAALQSGAPSVTLSVADRRPQKEGGDDTRRVGSIRALTGNSAGMREESPDAVRHLVEAATSEGLAASGIAATPGQPATLDVVIGKFWMDGYASYTAEIEASLSLRKGGAEVWTRTVKAKATGVQSTSPSEMFNRVWGWALVRYRDEVAQVVADPSFAAALGVRSAAPPAAAATAASSTAAGLPTVGLSVKSEFGIADQDKVSFEIRGRDALKKAELVESRGAFPELSIRYLSSWKENSRTKKIEGEKISTRLSLVDAKGETIWEESFEVAGTTTPTDRTDKSLLSANLGLVLDSKWVPELVRRLTSSGFRKALGR